jgi:hypothetical protein
VTLTQLHDGIDVPEYATRVPWLITEPQLAEYLPAGQFVASRAGWPQLPLTLLSVTAIFAFDFTTHPESRLLAVGFDHPADRDIDAVFRTNSAAIRAHLGDPNAIDHPDYHHLMWRDDRVWVDYSAGVPERPNAGRKHRLSVSFHAGRQRDWVPPGEHTLLEVRRLLNLMPGVKVIEVVGPPANKTLSLAVHSLPSLARLAHMTGWANVRFGVGVDEYRKANGELSKSDPTGLLYQIGIPGPHEPEPGGHATTLQILGIHLADDLREQGILEKEEARRLMVAFNNHEMKDEDSGTKTAMLGDPDC